MSSSRVYEFLIGWGVMFVLVAGVGLHHAAAVDPTDMALKRQKQIEKKELQELKRRMEQKKKQILEQKKKSGKKIVTAKDVASKIKGATPLDGLAGEVDIGSLVMSLAEFCGYNVIIDGKGGIGTRKGKKVKIYMHDTMTKAQACEVFRTLLELNDNSFYKAGAFFKIIKRREAAQKPIPIIEGTKVPVSAKIDFAIAFFKPKHLTTFPDHFASLGRFLVSKTGKSVFIQPDTTMIVDERRNLAKILKIFQMLDRPEPPFAIHYIEFKNLWVEEFAKMVDELFPKPDLKRWKPGKGVGYGPKYLVAATATDERTGKLVVVCNDAAYEKILELKAALDIDSRTEGMVRTYYVQHQDAKTIADTLNNAIKGQVASKKGGHKKGSRAAASTAILNKEVKIIAYEKLNAIIVSGDKRDIDRVIDIIKRLDSPRRQVFLEVHILELIQTKTNETGISLWYARNDDGTVSFVSSSYPGAQALVLNPSSLMGLAVGLRGEDIPGTDGMVQGIRLPGFATMLKLLESSSNVNVISDPFMLAQDGEEAKIIVGKSVPFITGGSIDRFGYPMITIQHQDVALQMKIVPKVSSHGTIRMDIDLELEDIEAMSDLYGPTTSKRAIKTSVITKDGAMVVIGGLEKSIETVDNSRIPILGDIPVIGHFFKGSSVRNGRRNLLFFIKPYVIYSEEDLKRLYRIKRREQEEFIKQFVHTRVPNIERPIDWDRKVGPVEIIRKTIEEPSRQDI